MKSPSFELVAAMAHAVQAERARMARDLHDGLGFHLVTALALTRGSTELAAGVRLALELAIVELHSVVHSAQAVSISIVDAMASLRYRMQPVFDQHAVQLAWTVDDDIPPDVLVGAPARHFIKVVQEALSNVLQHASATRLRVTLCHLRGDALLLLEVADNGRGLPACTPYAAASIGRGLASMQERAKALGAVLELLESQDGGTRIRLAVPLPCACN
jgi:two-component system sensor histidine kinase DevS